MKESVRPGKHSNGSSDVLSALSVHLGGKSTTLLLSEVIQSSRFWPLTHSFAESKLCIVSSAFADQAL
jgi:hypothetical protein